MLRYSYPRCAVELRILAEDWGADTATVRDVLVTPREVEVKRNDHRTADTARIQLDARDFPMDPRAVRSCAVRVLMADVGAPDGQLTEDDVMFAGFLDVPEVRREDSGSRVTLECRDTTSLWLDTPWTAGAVDISGTLQDTVEAMMAQVPGAKGQIGYSDGVDNIALGDIIGRTRFAPQKGDTAWAVLSDLLGRVALVPVYVGEILLILTPDDFGVDRATFLGTGDVTPYRAAFTFGSDVTSLEIRRNFVEARQRQIEVRCWDPAARKATSARYPAEAIVTKRKIGTDGQVTEEKAPILPFYVSGTYAAGDLDALAQRIYQNAAREEVQLEIETREMFPQAGNGARVSVDWLPTVPTDISGMAPGEAVRALTTGPRALAEDVAAAFVDGFEQARNLSREFYAQEVTHTWSAEEGYRGVYRLVNLLGGGA